MHQPDAEAAARDATNAARDFASDRDAQFFTAMASAGELCDCRPFDGDNAAHLARFMRLAYDELADI